MRKLLLSLTLLLIALLSPARSSAQFIVTGQGCGASGLTGIANDGTPVVCKGSPLVWTAVGGGGGGSGVGETVAVYAQTYTPFAGKILWTCSWTNGSATITCPSGTFASTDVGKIAFATNLAPTGFTSFQTSVLTCGSQVSDVTIASFQSSTQVTLSANCTATSAAGGNPFFFGPDETAGLAAFSTAVSNACATGIVPFGYALTKTSQFINPPQGCVNQTGASRHAPYLQGGGPGVSQIIIAPTMNWATCTGGNIGQACFFGAAGASNQNGGWSVQNLGLNGLGVSNYVVSAATILALFEPATYAENFFMLGIGANTTNLTCISVEGYPIVLGPNVQADGCGQVSAMFTATAVNSGPVMLTGGDFFGDSGGAGGPTFAENIIQNGGVISFGTTWGAAGNVSKYIVNVGANGSATTFNSFGDVWEFSGSANSVVGVGVTASGAIANIQSASSVVGKGFISAIASAIGIQLQSSGAIAHVSHTPLAMTGTTAKGILSVAGSTFYDDGDNQNTSTGNSISGAYIGNSGNSVLVTAPKLVLSAGWGSTAAVTALSGGTAPIGFTVTNSGTGQAASPTITYTFPVPYLVAPLSCTATQTGGTNATGTFTSSALSTTGVTFTFSLTPTASSTEIVQITCVTL